MIYQQRMCSRNGFGRTRRISANLAAASGASGYNGWRSNDYASNNYASSSYANNNYASSNYGNPNYGSSNYVNNYYPSSASGNNWNYATDGRQTKCVSVGNY